MDVDLNYIFAANPITAIIITFDILLISTIFLLAGFAASTFINKRLTTELNRNEKKIEVFSEVVSEALITIVFVIMALYLLPQLPSIVPNITDEHLNQRIKAKDFLLTFAIVACQSKFQDKIRFLLNDDDDANEIINEEIRQDFVGCNNNNQGFVCV